MQRLCSSNVIDCYRLQTSRNGKPVTEWLVNGNSLLGHIQNNEVMRDDTPAAIPNLATPVLPPIEDGDAKPKPVLPRTVEDIPNDTFEVENNLATPNTFGDASVVTPDVTFVANKPDVNVPPNSEQEKSGGKEVIRQSSEVELLIEKAVLRAQFEAKEAELASIVAIKDQEIAYLRDEKRELRENEKELQREVFELGKLSFKTFQNVSLKGVLSEPTGQGESSPQPQDSTLFGGAGDNPQVHANGHGV